MNGPFVHRIDPIFGEIGGLYLWWYGLSYALGFLEVHLWLRWSRRRLNLSLEEVYCLSLWLALGVVAGGRFFEVVLYEWPFYGRHLMLIPAVWLGGMATHGLVLGAVVGIWLFCRAHGRSLLELLDQLVIPGAFLLGIGRIGNFIDGQILGRVTDVWWAVKFPDAEGFRHPVVLYDGLKNLLLVPALLWVRRHDYRRGAVTAHFILWYGCLRIFVDLFREYPTTLLGVATGQCLNIVMTIAGIALLAWSRRNPTVSLSPAKLNASRPVGWLPKLAYAGLLAFCLTIPSDWTQDIPARYGKRHPGLAYSAFYRPIGGRP